MSSSFFSCHAHSLFDFSMSSTIFLIGLRLKSSRSSHPFTKKKSVVSLPVRVLVAIVTPYQPQEELKGIKPNDQVIHDKSVSFQVGVRFATEEMKRR